MQLNEIKVASPCPVAWNSMSGDNKVRFCGSCHMNVYNISDMSREEAERLIQKTEGRLCVRYYKRKDGTILTRDCPVGLKLIKQKFAWAAGVVAAAFAGLGFSLSKTSDLCYTQGELAYPSRAEVVVANRVIAPGEILSNEAFATKELDRNEVPGDFVPRGTLIVGRRASHAIQKGAPIGLKDLVPVKVKQVYLRREVAEGAILTKEDLEVHEEDAAFKQENVPSKISDVVGMQANSTLYQGTPLCIEQIQKRSDAGDRYIP
jgi:flagella basal body P-ring formation protein FlgA